MMEKLEYIPPGTVIGQEVIQPISFLTPESHPKKWGEEQWWVNNDKYCAKTLRFIAGTEFSDHYHWLKEETWICVSGELVLEYYDLTNADKLSRMIRPNDVVHIPPGNPHKLKAITDAVIWEVSTTHRENDSYRIGKGSSQVKVRDLSSQFMSPGIPPWADTLPNPTHVGRRANGKLIVRHYICGDDCAGSYGKACYVTEDGHKILASEAVLT